MHSVELPDKIQTSRLLLRGPLPSDIEAFHRVFVESQPELRRWFPWAEPTPTLEANTAFVEQSHRGFQEHRQLDWFICLKDSQQFIGVVTLHSAGMGRIDWTRTTQLLSYWLHTPHTRQGYMTEAAGAIVDFAFSLPNITQLEIYCDGANVRSAAVAQRLGFQYRETLTEDGITEDVYMKESPK